MSRKKKLRFIQVLLLITGITAIYLTYYNNETIKDEKIISSQVKEKFSKQNFNESKDGDVFYNIEYTGLALSGNRYLIKSEEAVVDKINPEIINMKVVNAVFYFKDETILYIFSDEGFYNNKNFDMEFRNNVKANYLSSKLYAEKAFYSNSESFLSISDNVRLNDSKGNLIADKLLFDIRSKKLDISSFKNGSINANVKLNEKRF